MVKTEQEIQNNIARTITRYAAPFASVEFDGVHLVVFNDVTGLQVRECGDNAKLAADTAMDIKDRYAAM